jgi:hypothetical protein
MERDIQFAGKTLRLRSFQSGWKGIIIGQATEVFYDDSREGVLAKMERHVLQGRAEFIGHQAAQAQFLKRFPLGFQDARLVDEKTSELAPKRRAAHFMSQDIPLESALIGDVDPDLFLKGMSIGGMMNKHDLIALGNVIRSSRGAQLITLLARFATDNLDQACRDLMRKFAQDGVANRSVLTYPAAMWRPDAHAFVLRTAGQDFAKRIGHRFGEIYRSTPEATVYSSYLSMLNEVRDELTDLKPKDYLDLQTYVHVVTKYPL